MCKKLEIDERSRVTLSTQSIVIVGKVIGIVSIVACFGADNFRVQSQAYRDAALRKANQMTFNGKQRLRFNQSFFARKIIAGWGV